MLSFKNEHSHHHHLYGKGLGNHKETNDKNGIADSYNNIGVVYFEQGKNDQSLENYFAALKIQEEIGDKLGKKALPVVHLNDSIGACGSLIDRHGHIGKGFIGVKAFKHIVNHPRLKDAAFILETPKDTPRADRTNLNRVRRLLVT